MSMKCGSMNTVEASRENTDKFEAIFLQAKIDGCVDHRNCYF